MVQLDECQKMQLSAPLIVPYFCLHCVLCDPAVSCGDLVWGLRGQKSLALE